MTAPAAITGELLKREPIFHQPSLGTDRNAIEALVAEDFWEVGASGRKYSKELVIETVVKRFAEGTEPDTSNWRIEDVMCRDLGHDTYALTYLLSQGERISRRVTLWQKISGEWKILYHQGTLVSE